MKQVHKWFCAFVAMVVLGSVLVQVHAQGEHKQGALSGVVIVVDPGHGGKDDGARSGDAKEQEINLAISMKLKSALEEQGAQVILTRDGAYDLASDGARNRKREDMAQRAAMINEDRVDLFISVHLNAYPNVAIHGAHTFYRKGDEASKALAQLLQERFNHLTEQEKAVKSGDYYILNETDKPGVLVECGFLSNEAERIKLMQEDYQQRLADAICEGIMEYLAVLA